MRDLRDPNELGTEILNLKATSRLKRVSTVANKFVDYLKAVPHYHDPSTSIERYGDPRERHRDRLERGTEPTVT